MFARQHHFFPLFLLVYISMHYTHKLQPIPSILAILKRHDNNLPIGGENACRSHEGDRYMVLVYQHHGN
jgi:hypothetical protein